MHTTHLAEFVLLLAVTVCFVPLFRRLGLSPIIGYFFAGMTLGPYGFGLLSDPAIINALAEFGVVFLLFVIGLELSFDRLVRMRGRMAGVGIAQVVITTLVFTYMGWLFGLSPSAALIVGGGLTLSSTAVVMELIYDGADRASSTGRLSLATLILQDLAVIPLLVLVPLLAANGSVVAALGEATLKAMIGLWLIVMIGRLLLKPLFRFITRHDFQELFTATTLLVVLGLAYISQLAGLSPALGAFMGGLLVAETEFKPQVEADILPFKSLFLGLFFTTVGMAVDLPLLQQMWEGVVGIALLLIGTKALILLALCLVAGFPVGMALHSALLLAQGSEFAFVLFNLASSENLLEPTTAQLLIAAVTLSMALTPVLQMAGKKLEKLAQAKTPTRPLPMREIMDVRDHVIIAGFGRVGRVIGQLLEAERIPYVALDMDANVVGAARKQGKPVYYGDAGRGIVLKAAGIMRAQAVILSHSNTRNCHLSIFAVRKLRHDVPVIARAKNFEQVVELEQSGANLALAEMLEISLQLGGALLKQIGVAESEVSRIVDAFRAEDYALTRRADTSGNGSPEEKTDEYTI